MTKPTYLRWLWLLPLFALLLLIQWSTKAAPASSTGQSLPPLLAFYYGWFDEQTWISDLSPNMPEIPYRSTDPATIARHVTQAREAGIEGFVMSWYGPRIEFNQTETNFRLLLDEAQRQGFTAAVDFETSGPFFPDRASVIGGLRYLLDTHARHPAYFRFNGKPVIFFWRQDRFSVEEWQSIRQEVDPNHDSIWIAEGTKLDYQFHFDGHHLYNIAWAGDVAATLNRWKDRVRDFGALNGLERYWVATTMPGFDERHLDRPDKNYRSRGEGEFYVESWLAAMATEPDMLIITSFNEWIEDSQIEPGVAYGDYYLDLTRSLRNGDIAPTATASPLPSPTPGQGSMIGLITDAVSGDRLAGVMVSVGGQTTLTNANGIYSFDGVSTGLQTALVDFGGYLPAQRSRTVVDGQLVWNSIALTPAADSTPTPTATATQASTPTPNVGSGRLIGLITSVESGLPLVGAAVSADGQTVATNGRGIYILAGLSPGEQLVSAEHPGFTPGSKTGFVVVGDTRWNSFALASAATPEPTATSVATHTPSPTGVATETATPSPTATEPVPLSPTPTRAPQFGTLVGLITNLETGERLAAVQVSANGQTVQTNSNGFYRFDTLLPGQHSILAEQEGFQPATKAGLVVLGQTRWNSIALTPQGLPEATPTNTAVPATSSPTATLPPAPTSTSIAATPTPTATSTPRSTDTPNPSPTETATTEPTATVTPLPSDTPIPTPSSTPSPTDTATTEPTVTPSPTATVTPTATPLAGCPVSSEASFDLIPIAQAAVDQRPDFLHGDLNLAQRGYSLTTAELALQDYDGGSDVNAPQLAGLFEPNDFSGIAQVYRANHWDWACGEHGCRGNVITDWPVTLVGLNALPGQPIHSPLRTPEIFGGGYKAMVLYAEEQRITLGYTRDDTVASGYAVHIENVCVDPNLLALYLAQQDGAGLRATGLLPALRDGEALGIALENEIQVTVRDRGAFLDPRSRKDWWQGY